MRIRVNGTANREEAGGEVTLFASSDKDVGIAVSIDTRERVTCWTGEKRYNGGAVLAPDEMYFVVMKIAARKTQPDNVTARVFRASDPLEIIEPLRWDGTGHAGRLNGTLDVLTTWSGESAVTLIDEIRVGTTWASVIPLR